jgi:hypothetical protein
MITLKSLLDSHEARMAAERAVGTSERFCPSCGGDIFECAGAAVGPSGYHEPCNGSRMSIDFDPEPITLTYMPRTGRRADWLGWLLLGLVCGLMCGWTLLLK